MSVRAALAYDLTRPSRTNDEFLRDAEHRFSLALTKPQWVFRADIDPAEAQLCSKVFGVQARGLMRVHRYTGREVVGRYPGVVLVSLVTHAATDYDKNTFWQHYWHKLQIPQSDPVEADFRGEIPKLLRKFGLKEFPSLRPIDQAAIHAAIPGYCLEALARAAQDHVARGGLVSGHAFLSYLFDTAHPERKERIHVPALNFLTRADAEAAAIASGLVEMASAVRELPSSLDNPSVAFPARAGLPQLMFDAYVVALAEVAAVPASQARRKDESLPYVSLAAVDDLVEVVLPNQLSGVDDRWLVSVDGVSTEVFSGDNWDGGASAAQSAKLPVTTPAARVEAEHPGSSRKFRFILANPADPLVVFDKNGRLLPRHEPLDQAGVIALVPPQLQLFDPVTKQQIETLAEFGEPTGWSGWRLISLNLEGCRALQLQDGHRLIGKERRVRRSVSAALVDGEFAPGMTTLDGSRVHSAAPTVLLPHLPGSEVTRWRVTTRGVESGKVLSDDYWDVTDDAEVAPFHGADGALVGSFEVVVLGPQGGRLRQVVHVAQGIQVDYSADFRVPAGDGLTPAAAQLAAGVDIQISPAVMSFAPDVVSLPCTISTMGGNDILHCWVRPPHTRLRVQPARQAPRWLPTPPTMLAQNIADQNLMLSFQIPETENAYISVVLRDKTGAILQEERPRYRERVDSFEVRVARFADTARHSQHADIVAVVAGTGRHSYDIPLVRIRPRQLYRTVRVDGPLLVFTGLPSDIDLSLQVWLRDAPQLRAHALPLAGDQVRLPDNLAGMGPLLVRLVEDDPWAPAEMPETPPADVVVLEPLLDVVAAPESVEEAIAVEPSPTAHSATEAVETVRQAPVEESPEQIVAPEPPAKKPRRSRRAEPPLPNPVFDRTWLTGRHQRGTQLWQILRELREWDRAAAPASPTEAAILSLLRANPLEAVLSLVRGDVPPECVPELLVVSGIAQSRFVSVGGGLEAIPFLNVMAHLERVPQRSLLPWKNRAVEQVVSNVGGAALTRIVMEGRDDDFRLSQFRGSTDGKRLSLTGEPGCLPVGAMVDAPSRANALTEVFQARDGIKLIEVSLATAVRPWNARSPFASVLAYAVGQRRGIPRKADVAQNQWKVAPAASFAFALRARAEAHKALTTMSPITDSELSAWAELARLCPLQTQVDLLIAEAIVVRNYYGAR